MKKTNGFDYYLEEDIIREYQKKPVSIRLKWLYQINILRMHLSKKIIKIHNKFREGKI